MKKYIGWAAILIVSFFPVLLWWELGPDFQETLNYATITHALGELTGLVGMTMMALTFLLSTRIRWFEDIFNGLDKVYITHGILGGTALVFILAHPIFLVLKFIPHDIQQAAIYLLPSQHWSVNFGILALLGLLFLVLISLFGKIKYQIWKFSHEFMGLIFGLAILHILMIRGDASADLIFQGYYVYATVVSLIGIFGFSYSLFFKDRGKKAARYRISRIKKRGPDIFQIEMTPEHKPLSYRAGQFIYVRFYNKKLSSEAHPFSITTASNSRTIAILVKILGDFTAQLADLSVGDVVSLEGPYGRFHYRSGSPQQIWVAGGIGVTPFLGLARDLAEHINSSSADSIAPLKVDMYYSCHADRDFICLDELKQIADNNPNFKLMSWQSNKLGHLTAAVIDKYSTPLSDKDIYISGPAPFKESLIAGLLKMGIKKQSIHTEQFELK